MKLKELSFLRGLSFKGTKVYSSFHLTECRNRIRYSAKISGLAYRIIRAISPFSRNEQVCVLIHISLKYSQRIFCSLRNALCNIFIIFALSDLSIKKQSK